MTRASTFFTPPRLDPVKLDLAQLGGGGSYPTQFDGQTTNGREVYVRYRGGALTINVATAPGCCALREGTRVLEVHLGPFLDGTISLTQFLRLTGLSVPHEVKDDENAGDELDLSGKTTFWRAGMLPTTDEGALDVVNTLRARASKVTEVSWQNGMCSRRPLEPGAQPGVGLLEFDAGQGLPKILLRYSWFQYGFPGYGGDGDDEKWSEKTGVPVSVAGSRDCELKFSDLSISADFPTNDTMSRSFLEHLSDDIDRLFPKVQYAEVDPSNGQVLDSGRPPSREDVRIRDWIAADTGRFRFLRWDMKRERHIGIRPG